VPQGSYQFSVPVIFLRAGQPRSFAHARSFVHVFFRPISLVRPRRRLSLAPTAERRRRRAQKRPRMARSATPQGLVLGRLRAFVFTHSLSDMTEKGGHPQVFRHSTQSFADLAILKARTSSSSDTPVGAALQRFGLLLGVFCRIDNMVGRRTLDPEQSSPTSPRCDAAIASLLRVLDLIM